MLRERKGEVIFGEDVGGGRASDGVTLLLSKWLLRCVVEWNEVSSSLLWVRVKTERASLCLDRHMDPVVRRMRRKFKNSGMS